LQLFFLPSYNFLPQMVSMSKLICFSITTVVFFVCLVASLLPCKIVEGQEPVDISSLEPLPGLIAIEEVDNASPIVRVDQNLQFDFVAGDAKSIASSKSRTTWSGLLDCRDSGSYQIKVFSLGRFQVKLDGVVLVAGSSEQGEWFSSKPFEMKVGRQPIDVEYQSTSPARKFGLYWTGPQFELEPISSRFLIHNYSKAADENPISRGRELNRALRCTACHDKTGDAPLVAPSLTHLRGNIQLDWLRDHLTEGSAKATSQAPQSVLARGRRMPLFGLNREDAVLIAQTLEQESMESEDAPTYIARKQKNTKKGDMPPRVEPSPDEGRMALLSLGCVACHQLNEIVSDSQQSALSSIEWRLFDGGNLSTIADKRTGAALDRWLDNPAMVNADHRMPVFNLSPIQKADLGLYLRTLKTKETKDAGHPAKLTKQNSDRGRQLIEKHRCGACHQLPNSLKSDIKRIVITKSSDWQAGCLVASDAKSAKPGYQLGDDDRRALKAYWTESYRPKDDSSDAVLLLAEHNCLRCHARDSAKGLFGKAAELIEFEPDLSSRLSALMPPSLSGVGDKLHDLALLSTVLGQDSPRRPWLDIQMPKFKLTKQDGETLVKYFISRDRIPDLPSNAPSLPADKAVQLAAERLVTAEGFGCQSCHKIGSAEPPKVAINAHGTDLTMLGDRIRPGWFKRWVRNPSRIVARMEMPAIQTAVKGVLGDDLDVQLSALWKTLNTQGFEPPKPNPVRVVRSFNQPGRNEWANVLTDVLETPDKKYLRPLIVGLSNRHNILVDFESGSVGPWWIGDTARQYTRGKSWYWEPGASPIAEGIQFLQKHSVVDRDGQQWEAKSNGQFVIQFDSLEHIADGIRWRGRIEFRHGERSRMMNIQQALTRADDQKLSIATTIEGMSDGDQIVLGLPSKGKLSDEVIICTLGDHAVARWRSDSGSLTLKEPDRRSAILTPVSANVTWALELESDLPPDRFQAVALPSTSETKAPFATTKSSIKPIHLDCVPGFSAVQLPLLRSEMPTAMAWRNNGEMFIASLKGRVLKLTDTDGDGLEDRMEAISDDLPAPYGLHANEQSIDVLCKTSLIRLELPTPDSATKVRNQRVVADGWGYTADYHDWAVGLVRKHDGSYCIALPCQQDERSEAAAYLRGQALRLVPYQNPESPRAYRIETIAAGLRFPMGLALSRDEELFATDNQGNFNPFNELNHIQSGKRYGFINKLESKPGFSPPFESPAINLPHPWTRSVNGLCFLNTPKTAKTENTFGPFEGDLVGCEYNGLSLIRMSLQKVRDQYQGAAYMFSRPVVNDEPTFEGPVCCTVAPSGDLYIGSIHDSGWGGGQNTGSIVRLHFQGPLPLGIDELRATSFGFELELTAEVDKVKAEKVGSYSIRSYRRVSTPAYGGDDQDERTEVIQKATVSDDRRKVRLHLNDLRGGCVYEVNVGPIGEGSKELFPNQAHYNMRVVPDQP
jgi:hypothetical protein